MHIHRKLNSLNLLTTVKDLFKFIYDSKIINIETKKFKKN